MNYTENFHLPQWDEDDRIMRVDFNGAMVNLEEGLTEGRGQWSKNLNRLCRTAYNHYCMVQSLSAAPEQIGVFRQDPAKGTVAGAQLLNGIQCAWNCPGTLSAESLEGCFQELTALRMVKGNLAASSPMTANFTPPVSGKIMVFNMPGSYNYNSEPCRPKFRASLTNRDSGVVEQTVEFTAEFGGSAGGFVNTTVSIPITFLGGARYLFKVEMLEALCDTDIHFSPYTKNTGLLSTYHNGGSAEAAWTVLEPEGGMGGIVILRCLICGKGGTLRFKWDGMERKPYLTRKASTGTAYQEFIYLRDDPIPTQSRLSMRFDCAEGGSFQFYDWGAVLF